MIPPREVTGVILCGGEGRRLGGKEKALELAAGTTLFAHARARLAPQVDRIVVSANRSAERYAAFGDLVVADVHPGLGPLGGIRSVLPKVTTALTFTCPGDAPLLPSGVVDRLASAMQESAAEIAVAHDGERLQPLFMLLRTSLHHALEQFLAAGGRAAHEWVASRRSVVVELPAERDGFRNINRAADLAVLERLMTAAGAVA